MQPGSLRDSPLKGVMIDAHHASKLTCGLASLHANSKSCCDFLALPDRANTLV